MKHTPTSHLAITLAFPLLLSTLTGCTTTMTGPQFTQFQQELHEQTQYQTVMPGWTYHGSDDQYHYFKYVHLFGNDNRFRVDRKTYTVDNPVTAINNSSKWRKSYPFKMQPPLYEHYQKNYSPTNPQDITLQTTPEGEIKIIDTQLLNQPDPLTPPPSPQTKPTASPYPPLP